MTEATSQATGSIGVLVTDPDYAPLAQAEVSLDGEVVGRTSSDGTLLVEDVPVGEHKVQARKPGFERLEKSVEVNEGETIQTVFKLEKKASAGEKGTLVVLVFDQQYNAIEGSKVYLDGELVDVTNPDGVLEVGEVDTGEHRVKAQKKGYKERTKSVEVKPGETVEFVLRLERKAEEPVGQTIYVDDDFADTPKEHKWDTIQEGIDDATDGDTLKVIDGTYEEQLRIQKEIILQGSGRHSTTIKPPYDAKSTIIVDQGEVHISGFTIQGAEYSSINLKTNAELNLLTTAIACSGSPVGISANSSIKMKGNVVWGCSDAGLHMRDGELQAKNNTFTNNASHITSNSRVSAIFIEPQAIASFVNNSIVGNVGHGIGVWGQVQAEFISNHIVNNGGFGITVFHASCYSAESGGSPFTGMIEGRNNEVSRNGEGNFCPSYPGPPWPPGFKKSR